MSEPGGRWKTAAIRIVTVAVFAVGDLVAAGSHATAASQIRLLSPSPLEAGQVPELVTSGGPTHFVAWVQEVPPTPQVEFELQLAGGAFPGQAQTIDAVRVGDSPVWEAYFEIPSTLAEGQYTLLTRLYSAGTEVANFSQITTLDQADVPPAADAVEIQYPANGEAFGLHRAAGRLVAGVRVGATEPTDQIQVFYTAARPGTPPSWTSCGSAARDGTVVDIRCEIPGSVAAESVTAVAAVANNTPAPGSPQRLTDDGMDAHRVLSYAQAPAQVSISPSATRSDPTRCQLFTATVLDGFSRPVVGAAIDVHAEGPSDQLRFAVADTTPLTSDTHPFQAPNESHLSREQATRCSDSSPTGQQGDHNQIGRPDRKHIESLTGTDVNGEFVFALRTDVAGTTSITAWADAVEDDFQSASEATGTAQVGWGQDPPAPSRYVFLDPDLASASTGKCLRVVAVARDGSGALAGANLDVHLKGPTSTSFCSPRGADPRRRPDDGGHTRGRHSDGTRHVEATADGEGRFVFGVTSAASGDSDLTLWLDEFDDDTLGSGEPSSGGRISWVRKGERSISIRASKRNVQSGDTVEISGEIIGDPRCEDDEQVVLKAREEGGVFATLARTSTNPRGFYSFQVEVTTTREYRTVAPRGDSCLKARSQIITIRAR